MRHEDAGLARLAILGLWTLTLYEYALTLLRLDERARAYFGITVANVLVTIPFTVWLIVVEGERASGILLGTFGTGAVFAVWMLWRERRRLSLRPGRSPPAADVPVRAADDAGRAVALLAQLHRPDHPRADGRARRGGPVRARRQVRPGHAGARSRLSARLAAARLLDPGRRGGAARLLGDLHLVRRRARLRGRRACGSSARWIVRLLAAPGLLRRPTRRSACWRPASPSTRSTWRWW